MNPNWYKAGVVILLIFSASCVPTNQLRYFNDINEIAEEEINPRLQKTIMPFDKIFIRVLSIDPQTSQIFNSAEEMRFGGANNGIIGYLVNENGDINFPFVGTIKVESLTTTEAAEKIQNALDDYVSKTSIVVKYIDNQITIIGEVQRQGVYSFTQDKLTIYDAIGLGGGLTRYGDRKNVILIRNVGNTIKQYRLNLSDSRVAGSSFYYIIPNDVIVVEPLKAISSSYSNITFTTILTSITTLIAVLLFTGVKF